MTKLSRHLILTADEQTWKFDEPVVFLGEWCRNYDRKHIWGDMDAIVAEPYGLGQSQKDRDHIAARVIEDRLFKQICVLLNQHHSTNYSERFWKIVLGHWLRNIVDLLFNRINTILKLTSKYKISSVTFYENSDLVLPTTSSYETHYISNNDRWNNELYARIMSLLELKNLHINFIKKENLIDLNLKIIAEKTNTKKTFLKLLKIIFFKTASLFVKDNDAFFIKSYFPKKTQLLIQLFLRQIPMFWNFSRFSFSKKPDLVLRKKLASQITTYKSQNIIENIIKFLIFELIPLSYLEEFENINKFTKAMNWPKQPKFIFTSNSFDNDEVFKIWTASKVERGSKYFAGQHGNYGVSRNHFEPSIEEVTSDKFFTWGWKDGLPQHTPTYMFIKARNKINYSKSVGGLLLIELSMPHRVKTWDVVSEYIDYFEAQKEFVSKLDLLPRQNLTIRLHADHQNLNWCDEARWKEFDSKLKIILLRKLELG